MYACSKHACIHTYCTYIHTLTREPSAFNKLYKYTCTPEHNIWELFQMKTYGDWWGGGGAVSLKAKHYIFVGVAGLFFFFFSNPVGGWLLWKCIIFCKWWSFSKMQLCAYLLFKWDLLEWSLGPREKLSPGENTVLYPGKTRLFLPAILAGNLNPGTSSALPGLTGG